MRARLLVPAALAVLVAGCMVGPDYRRPDVELPGQFAGNASQGAPVIDAQWWKLYREIGRAHV